LQRLGGVYEIKVSIGKLRWAGNFSVRDEVEDPIIEELAG